MTGRPYYRGGDAWALVLQGLPGLQKRKEVRFHGTRAEAELKVAALLTDIARGTYIEPSKMTLPGFLESWLENEIRPDLRPNTYGAYQTILRKIQASPLGSLRLQKLTTEDLASYFRGLVEVPLQPSTMQNYKNMLSTAFRFAVKRKFLAENLATDIKIPRKIKTSSRSTMRTYTEDQTYRLFAAAGRGSHQTSALFAVFLDSGMRLGEVQGLSWTAVDLASGMLRVERQYLQRQKVYGETKSGESREFKLTDVTVERLRRHQAAQAEEKLRNRLYYDSTENLVFCRSNEEGSDLGKPLAQCTIRARMTRLIREAGVPRLRVHDLRHTCASLMLAAGVPVHVVSEQLGHANTSITMNIYAHVIPSQKNDAARRREAVFSGAAPTPGVREA